MESPVLVIFGLFDAVLDTALGVLELSHLDFRCALLSALLLLSSSDSTTIAPLIVIAFKSDDLSNNFDILIYYVLIQYSMSEKLAILGKVDS